MKDVQIREEAEGEKTRCRGERSRCHLQQRSTNLRLSCSANKAPTDDRCDSPLLDPNQPLATVCVCVCVTYHSVRRAPLNSRFALT